MEQPKPAPRARASSLLAAILAATAVALMLATPAGAQAKTCYADYKAKHEHPFELHYGVMKVSACSKAEIRDDMSKRLAKAGWDLLNIVSVFDESGLQSRKANAGSYYLRF